MGSCKSNCHTIMTMIMIIVDFYVWQILYRWYVLHLTAQASPSMQYSSAKSILAKHINDSIFIIDMLNILYVRTMHYHTVIPVKNVIYFIFTFLYSNFIAILEQCTSFLKCWMMIQLSGQNLRFRIYVFSQIEKDICMSFL